MQKIEKKSLAEQGRKQGAWGKRRMKTKSSASKFSSPDNNFKVSLSEGNQRGGEYKKCEDTGKKNKQLHRRYFVGR